MKLNKKNRRVGEMMAKKKDCETSGSESSLDSESQQKWRDYEIR